MPGIGTAPPDQNDGDIRSIGLGGLLAYGLHSIQGFLGLALPAGSGATGVTVVWVAEFSRSPHWRPALVGDV